MEKHFLAKTNMDANDVISMVSYVLNEVHLSLKSWFPIYNICTELPRSE